MGYTYTRGLDQLTLHEIQRLIRGRQGRQMKAKGIRPATMKKFRRFQERVHAG